MKLIEANPIHKKLKKTSIYIEKGFKPSISTIYDFIKLVYKDVNEPMEQLNEILNRAMSQNILATATHTDGCMINFIYKLLNNKVKPYRVSSVFLENIAEAKVSDKVTMQCLNDMELQLIELPNYVRFGNMLVKSFFCYISDRNLTISFYHFGLDGKYHYDFFHYTMAINDNETINSEVELFSKEPAFLSKDVSSFEIANFTKLVIKLIVYIFNCDNDLEIEKPVYTKAVNKDKRINHYRFNLQYDVINVGYSFHGRDYSSDKWKVSGHWRFQPHGENRKKVKLIWIDEHESGRNEKLLTTGKKENNPIGFNMKLIEANPRRPEKGTNKLRPIKELIKGGIADGMSDELFDSVELEKGIKVELEHTDDEMIAKEIAKDHLAEDSEYYKKLSKIHIEKNPHSTVGEFYTNLYMVSYLKKVKKENYEANMVFDNRDNTFEVNVIKLPNYVATTKSFSTDDLGKFNLEAKKYFTDFEVDRFHKEVQKYLNDEVIKGIKKENPVGKKKSSKAKRNEEKCFQFLREQIMIKMNPIITYNALEAGLVKDYFEISSQVGKARREGNDEAYQSLVGKFQKHPFRDMIAILQEDENFSMDYESTHPTIEEIEEYVEYSFPKSTIKTKHKVPEFDGDIGALIEFYIDHIVFPENHRE